MKKKYRKYKEAFNGAGSKQPTVSGRIKQNKKQK